MSLLGLRHDLASWLLPHQGDPYSASVVVSKNSYGRRTEMGRSSRKRGFLFEKIFLSRLGRKVGTTRWVRGKHWRGEKGEPLNGLSRSPPVDWPLNGSCAPCAAERAMVPRDASQWAYAWKKRVGATSLVRARSRGKGSSPYAIGWVERWWLIDQDYGSYRDYMLDPSRGPFPRVGDAPLWGASPKIDTENDSSCLKKSRRSCLWNRNPFSRD